jgi:hypothetical protein
VIAGNDTFGVASRLSGRLPAGCIKAHPPGKVKQILNDTQIPSLMKGTARIALQKMGRFTESFKLPCTLKGISQ